MIKSFILLALQIAISNILLSQDNGLYIFNDSTTESNNQTRLILNKTLIDTTTIKTIKTNKENIINSPEELNKNIALLKSKNNPTLNEGYSIQLLFDKDINKVKEAQSVFTTKHPEIHNYLSYKEPNFRLRVGSFRTKMEASKLLEELKLEYPGAYEVTELNIKSPQLN